ncbi:hypothetical protein [Dolichospermum sp. UHCC 0259]|uniref:hypothetical protein n=1 Tax=Dolichospermum sp. UHCC 0259 TaxID=2590010 RepID=UPI001445096F|nr:hypothetical protein [Dolichospermum sp. UHCC 0259]
MLKSDRTSTSSPKAIALPHSQNSELTSQRLRYRSPLISLENAIALPSFQTAIALPYPPKQRSHPIIPKKAIAHPLISQKRLHYPQKAIASHHPK